MDILNENITSVIGFDLGHGETSISFVSLNSDSPPRTIEIDNMKSIVTAIGRDRNGFVIGNKVFRIPDIKDVKIGFKCSPSSPNFSKKIIQEYTNEIFKQLEKKSLIKDLNKCYVFVGCPSGWSQIEVIEYENLIRQTLIENVKVVKESRAALLQAKETQIIESEDLKGSVVVIDVGSLTVDISHVFSGTEDAKIDTGVNLGSGIIDTLIYDYSIENSDNKAIIFDIINKDTSGHLKSLCLYACRGAKEIFFNNEEEFRSYNNNVNANYVKIGLENNILFEPKVNATIMNIILNKKCIELGNRSWLNSFEELLVVSQNELNSRGNYPNSVLLTGGASRMSFIQNICKKIFPASKVSLYSPPEETVSFGLSRWGKIYLQTTKFTDEVAELCRKRLPDQIDKYKDFFANSISESISIAISDKVVLPAVLRWKSGSIDKLTDLELELSKSVENWFKSYEGKELITKSCIEILDPITTYVNSQTLMICKKSGIPHSVLQINTDYNLGIPMDNIDIIKPFDGLINVSYLLSFLSMIIGTIILKGVMASGFVISGGTGGLFAVIGGIAVLFGSSIIKEKLKYVSFPIWMRENILSNDKIEKIISTGKEKIKKDIYSEIELNKFPYIKETIANTFENELQKRANEVKWIID